MNWWYNYLDPKTRIQNHILGGVLIPKSSISPADRRTSTVPDFHGKLANVDDLNWKFTSETTVKKPAKHRWIYFLVNMKDVQDTWSQIGLYVHMYKGEQKWNYNTQAKVDEKDGMEPWNPVY